MSNTLGPKVEIISDGGRRAVFINGVHIGQVTAIETPHEIRDLSYRTRFEFIASEVVARTVLKEEFEARTKG